jgi:hypothetical protein
MSAISWFEIPATDIERARRFYEAIFATAMKPLDLGDLQMALFPAGGGALCQHRAFYKPSAESGPLVYLNAAPDLSGVRVHGGLHGQRRQPRGAALDGLTQDRAPHDGKSGAKARPELSPFAANPK